MRWIGPEQLSSRGERLQKEAEILEGLGRRSIAVPQVLAHDHGPFGAYLVVVTIPGVRALDLGPGFAQAHELGQVLGELHRLSPEGLLKAPGDSEPAPGEVLCHGDFWPGNLLRGPSGWVVLDWEDVHLGDPGRDLAIALVDAFFLFSKCQAGELLRGYQEVFVASNCMSPRLEPIDWEDLAWAYARLEGLASGDLSSWSQELIERGRGDLTVPHLEAKRSELLAALAGERDGSGEDFFLTCGT